MNILKEAVFVIGLAAILVVIFSPYFPIELLLAVAVGSLIGGLVMTLLFPFEDEEPNKNEH